MSFTSWSALRDDIKDKLAAHVSSSAMAGEYSIGSRRLKYRSYEELMDLLKLTFELEALETAGSTSTTVSYGRYRRF